MVICYEKHLSNCPKLFHDSPIKQNKTKKKEFISWKVDLVRVDLVGVDLVAAVDLMRIDLVTDMTHLNFVHRRFLPDDVMLLIIRTLRVYKEQTNTIS